MKLPFILVACCVAVVLIASCTISDTTLPPTASQPRGAKPAMLSLKVSSTYNAYGVTETIPLTLSLMNISSDAIVIKPSKTRRLPAQKILGKATISITDTLESKELPFVVLNLTPPNPDEPTAVISLAPGETYTFGLSNARALFLFEQGHQYLVQAAYQHDSTEGWHGELKSDPILITIQ